MRQNKSVTRVLQRLFNLIYPRRCPICDEIVGGFDRLICCSCSGKLHRVREPLCKKCGKPLEEETAEYCPDCVRRSHAYVRGRAALEYDAFMRGSIGRFKYKNRREYADFYVRELLTLCGDAVKSWDAQALVPIPLHRERRRRRGFNQAELVARGLGRELGIPVRTDLLFRKKRTKPQKDLTDRERRSNLKNAFQAGKNDVRLERVILIDDIYTTGSTIDAAASVLLGHGVENVYFLSICIGRGF